MESILSFYPLFSFDFFFSINAYNNSPFLWSEIFDCDKISITSAFSTGFFSAICFKWLIFNESGVNIGLVNEEEGVKLATDNDKGGGSNDDEDDEVDDKIDEECSCDWGCGCGCDCNCDCDWNCWISDNPLFVEIAPPIY